MHIHRVRGQNLRDALQRARRAYGEEAVVVGRETSSSGAVTLAVADRAPARPKAKKREDAFEREVASRLVRTGATRALVDRVAGALDALPADERHIIDRSAQALGSLFTYAQLKRAPGAARALAFVGPAGSGKTTSLSKLAVRLVRAGRRVGLATFDTRRVGALEGLRATAGLLGAPFFPLRSDRDPVTPEILASRVELLLVDTCGRPEQDVANLSRLWPGLKKARWSTDTQLVLPATSSRAALDQVRSAFAALELSGCVLTRLDETREPAPLFEHVLDCGLPLAFLADGPELNRHFRRADADAVADVLLRGRLS